MFRINTKKQEEAQAGLSAGLNKLADAVKVTLGPKGKTVFIDRGDSSPKVTKDGVSVAKELFLRDPLENMGAQVVKEVASKTVDQAGDGTTTATVLAQAIVNAGLKSVAAGANPMDLKRGIDKAVEAVVSHLKTMAQPVADDHWKIRNVATLSANGDDEIGRLVAEAMIKVGTDGLVRIEDSHTSATRIETVQGMQVNAGSISPYFITDQSKMETVLENPYILVCDKSISALTELASVLNALKDAQTTRPLFIICEDLDGEALATIVHNRINRNINIFAVFAPSTRGEHRKNLLKDISILTGAAFVTESVGMMLSECDITRLGSAEKVVFDRKNTTIIQGLGDREKIENQVAGLRTLETATENPQEKALLKERIAGFVAGIGVIYVGATTEVELKEKKDRVDDSVKATRAAMEEGIVPGGGVAYLRAIPTLDGLKGANEDENTGIQIIRRTLQEPLRQIVENGAGLPDVVVTRVMEGEGDFGYNARTDQYENLSEAGVIDPAKVARVALQNAASVAAMVLTAGAALVIEGRTEQ